MAPRYGGKRGRSSTRGRLRSLSNKLRKGRDRNNVGYWSKKGPRIEQKFHDLDIDDATVAVNGTIAEDTILEIGQGTTEKLRIGRKVTVRRIAWRWRITLPTTTTPADTADVVRVMLILDKQCNGAAATAALVLEFDDYQSFNNLANSRRFTTLMDRTYKLKSPSGSYDGTNDQFGVDHICDSYYGKFNLPIEYNSTAGAITEIRSNNIFVLLLGLNGKASFQSKMRVRFTD